MVVVLVIALVIFGPKKLPQLGESLGKAISSFRKGMNEGQKEEQAKAPQIEKKQSS
jgi:sec-independent protein translocase protein TatA